MSLNTNTLPTASDLSSEKRSVCLINDSFPPVIDGVANAVTNYASIIQRSFGDATVVTPYYPDADDSIYPFPVLRYPSIDVTKLVGYRAGLPLSPELMAQVEGRHIDLIHSHCPVTSTILARMLRQRLHVPLVFTYHTKFDIDIANAIHSKRLQEASIKLLVENISACDEVWTVSRGAGENLRSLGYQGDYIVMPNGVDIPADRLPEETVRAVSEGLDLPEVVPLLLFVGRMMWYKGLRIILDALKQLKGEGQDFRMVFIGKGTDGEAIRAYAEELCLGDKVFFLPPCYDREIIRAWYCRADLFLFPSTFDTNGLVVREAAACGLAEDERDEKNRYIYLTFYDKAFEAYCLGEFDVDGDGRISRYEAQRVRTVECPERGVASLSDLKEFTRLERLDCRGNALTRLDVTMTRLEWLDCSDNGLVSLDVNGLRGLAYLDCGGNSLPRPDLQSNASLATLLCPDNALAGSLDVTSCASGLRADVRGNPSLATVYCLASQSVDFNGPTELIRK